MDRKSVEFVDMTKFRRELAAFVRSVQAHPERVVVIQLSGIPMCALVSLFGMDVHCVSGEMEIVE